MTNGRMKIFFCVQCPITCILNDGWTRHLAAAIILAVRGPDTPTLVINSVRFGVNLNGTGLLASSSPVTSSMSNLK